MQNHDRPKFTTLIGGIGELYGKAASESLMDLYWQTLKDFEFQDVREAFKLHIHNPDGEQFLPNPADVAQFIESSGEIKALRAWRIVERVMRQMACYESFALTDPITQAVLEHIGDWLKPRAVVVDNLPDFANEFKELYLASFKHFTSNL